MYEYEKIVMTPDELDDGSVVINFDITDDYNIPTQQGGYVMARNEDDSFVITVFDAEGDVVSETVLPHKFKEV